MNSRLRSAIQAARSANMPKDNIERAIDKSSMSVGLNFEHIRYEGFGPAKTAVVVITLTDNKTEQHLILEQFSKNMEEDLAHKGLHHIIFFNKE